MAETTAHLALRREAAVPESRAIQGRLMTGLALAAAGAMLAVLLLMGGSMEREADALEKVWARGPQPGACAPAELPEGTEVFPPPAQSDSHCVVETPPAEARVGATGAAEPAAARPAAPRQAAVTPPADPPAATRPPKRSSGPPTYIRIRKPEPKPDPAQLALEGLRGRI